MRLKDFEKYDKITIQAHDNPDADAIASGYALYSYYSELGKDVSLIYSGRYQIQKTDLKLMIEKLQIPIEYRAPSNNRVDGLLITVDCQHGAGNVQLFDADEVVVIDHHQQEIMTNRLLGYEISSNLGSCATLVWKLLVEEGYPIKENVNVGTALYYGLFRDTNQFTELCYPLDMDMREAVAIDKNIIHLLRNSNLSLKELEIAGIALIRYIYISEYHFAIIQTQPCDPNLLGLISDFLIQVDEIYTCVVFNQLEDGYKYSVRSCIREVRASELAHFLAQDIGSGGGHVERAGGFLSTRMYEKFYPTTHAEAYFENKMKQYFDSFDILDIQLNAIDTSDMETYERKLCEVGYVNISDLVPDKTSCVIRTLEGDIEILMGKEKYILINDSCKVKVLTKNEFNEQYKLISGECNIKLEYTPKLKNRNNSEDIDLMQYLGLCTRKNKVYVLAKELVRGIKIFTSRVEESYLLGNPGDYVVVKADDPYDISIVGQKEFHRLYQKV